VRRQQTGSRQAADSSIYASPSLEEARRGREAAAPCLFCAAGSSSIRHKETDRQQTYSRCRQSAQAADRQAAETGRHCAQAADRQQTDSRHAADSSMYASPSPEEARAAGSSSIRHQETDRQQAAEAGRQCAQAAGTRQ